MGRAVHRLRSGVVVLAVLGACKVGPDFVRPEAKVPGSWRDYGTSGVSGQKSVDTLWWKAFNDGTLDRLVETSVQQNLPLQVVGLRIIEARARLGAKLAEITSRGLSPSAWERARRQ